MHHPFTDFASLRKVTESLQVCVLGIVVKQPGAVQRSSEFGDAVVCNAVLLHKDLDIQCSFWRSHGEELAKYAEGDAVVLMQVTVKKKAEGWELRATEATRIMPCPRSLRQICVRVRKSVRML